MTKNKGQYVDGYVLVVPKKKLLAYKKMASKGAKLWMKHGALDYKECVLDDARPKWVVLTFPALTKTKPGEVVFFSYITYKSRAHRDAVNAKVMKDPAMHSDNADPMKDMPFDMKRMAYGGFKVLVSG